MSKRAVLLDKDDVEIAHLTYAEMDAYITAGLVERLTPLKATTHKFRLLEQKQKREVIGRLEFDQCSLTAAMSRANAGVTESTAKMLWAKRRVRIWPQIGDQRAPRVACGALRRERTQR